MADAPATTGTKSSSIGFLGRKIGPLPVWAWGAIAFGAYYWYTHYGPGAQPAAATAVVRGPAGATGKTGARGGRGFRGYRGPRGYRGARGYAEPDPDPRASYAAAARGSVPQAAEPQRVAAPTTGADVYGSSPVAMPDSSTYDSGDVVSTMGAAYAVAG